MDTLKAYGKLLLVLVSMPFVWLVGSLWLAIMVLKGAYGIIKCLFMGAK